MGGLSLELARIGLANHRLTRRAAALYCRCILLAHKRANRPAAPSGKGAGQLSLRCWPLQQVVVVVVGAAAAAAPTSTRAPAPSGSIRRSSARYNAPILNLNRPPRHLLARLVISGPRREPTELAHHDHRSASEDRTGRAGA